MGAALELWAPRQIQRSALLLLLAWLPTLAFFGHWESLAAPFTSAGVSRATHTHSPTSDREHAQHCHAGFEDCGGGASAITLPGSAPLHAAARTPEGRPSDLVLTNELAPSGFDAAPLTPPPRQAD